MHVLFLATHQAIQRSPRRLNTLFGGGGVQVYFLTLSDIYTIIIVDHYFFMFNNVRSVFVDLDGGP